MMAKTPSLKASTRDGSASLAGPSAASLGPRSPSPVMSSILGQVPAFDCRSHGYIWPVAARSASAPAPLSTVQILSAHRMHLGAGLPVSGEVGRVAPSTGGVDLDG